MAATPLFGKTQSEDLPSSIASRFLAFCCCLVFAQHKPKKGRKEPPLLQHRGEPRISAEKPIQRTVLYLGEINDQQQASWRKNGRSR